MTALLVAALSVQLLAPPVAPPDPCQLVTAAEIAAALGKTPSASEPSSRPLDAETGAKMSSCTRSVGDMVFDISVTEFPDARRADSIMTVLAKTEPADEDEAKLVPASGVGDRSLFGATKIGAHWFAQKGKFTVSVTLAGELGDGTRYRESLKKLAVAAVARL
jgi:hypothetical protein